MTKATIKVTREELRDRLLGHAPKPVVKTMSLFGCEIDLRQPTLRSILAAQEIDSAEERAANMMITFAFVPGTSEKIFEEADKEMILNWPFGEDLQAVQTAIAELTGVNIGEAEEELKTDPLKEQS
jgi:hypothetical protein